MYNGFQSPLINTVILLPNFYYIKFKFDQCKNHKSYDKINHIYGYVNVEFATDITLLPPNSLSK